MTQASPRTSLSLALLVITLATGAALAQPRGGGYTAQVLDTTFVTADQLYSDNQMYMSSGPFIYPKPELHPFTTSVLLESYNYSRSSLGAVNARSGLGVHTLWGPAIGARASDPDDPMARREVLMGMIGMFAEAAGATPPANAWPQFLEFESGDPHFPQAVDTDGSDGTTFGNDFSSIRWDRSKMDSTIDPAALGQTMFKQVLWAEAFFSMNHRGEGGGVKMGGDPVEGFSGFVLTANALNKMLALKNWLAFDAASGELGGVDPMSYDPAAGLRYFPHRIAVDETPVMPGVPPRPSFTVADPSSDLFDQASLLWGLSEFAFYADPAANTADPQLDSNFDAVFDGTLFPRAAESPADPPGPFDLARGMSLVVYKNLKAQHFDPARRVFVDSWRPFGGRRSTVSAFEAGFVLVALANLQAQELRTPKGVLDVSGDIRDQADFLVARLIDPEGGAFNGFTLSSDGSPIGVPDRSTKTLLAQGSVIQGLLAAYKAVPEQRYLDAAEKLFAYLQRTFYDEDFRGYRSSADPTAPIRYTPRLSGAILGALRELYLVAGIDTRDLYSEQFDTVVNGKTHTGGGLVLAETPLTGEVGPVDSDGDGIPAMSAAPGPFGMAPVLAAELTFTPVVAEGGQRAGHR